MDGVKASTETAIDRRGILNRLQTLRSRDLAYLEHVLHEGPSPLLLDLRPVLLLAQRVQQRLAGGGVGKGISEEAPSL